MTRAFPGDLVLAVVLAEWGTELLQGAAGFRDPLALLLTVPLHRACVSRLALPLLSRYTYTRFAWLVVVEVFAARPASAAPTP